jgi:hypothetical protein
VPLARRDGEEGGQDKRENDENVIGIKRMRSTKSHSRTRGKQAEARTERGRKAKLVMLCLHDACTTTLQELRSIRTYPHTPVLSHIL